MNDLDNFLKAFNSISFSCVWVVVSQTHSLWVRTWGGFRGQRVPTILQKARRWPLPESGLLSWSLAALQGPHTPSWSTWELYGGSYYASGVRCVQRSYSYCRTVQLTIWRTYRWLCDTGPTACCCSGGIPSLGAQCSWFQSRGGFGMRGQPTQHLTAWKRDQGRWNYTDYSYGFQSWIKGRSSEPGFYLICWVLPT